MSVFDKLSGVFTDRLGEPLVYIPPGGGFERNIVGVWENEYFAVDGLAGAPIDSAVPAAHVNKPDVPFVGQGGQILRGGDCFKIRSARPDGKGMTTLILEKVKNNG